LNWWLGALLGDFPFRRILSGLSNLKGFKENAKRVFIPTVLGQRSPLLKSISKMKKDALGR
jgi:hypothetical protein